MSQSEGVDGRERMAIGRQPLTLVTARGRSLDSLRFHRYLEFAVTKGQPHDGRTDLLLHLLEQWGTREERGAELWCFALTHEILEGSGLHQDMNP